MDQQDGVGVALLREDVYRRLRSDILSCRLLPGIELRESDLADQFAVSKSPVRDALSRLERERLVFIRPRQGYQVAPISLKDAQDMFRFRAILEGTCVREAAKSATEEQLRALDEFRHFDPEAESFVGHNRAFHASLVALSGNERIKTTAGELIEQMDRAVKLSVSLIKPADEGKLVAQHATVIDALQDRDGARAERVLRAHIRAGEKRVCTALERFIVVR
jgi:DNA-binding GntR family transcriptional regulator